MEAPKLALCLALGASLGFAQGENKPEIRGSVIESGLNIGVPGAEITLFEFLLDAEKTVVRTQIATTSTDTHGEFQFSLEHFGNYYVEAKRDTYFASLGGFDGNPSESTGTPASVTRDHPSYDVRFSLMRPGGVTGRVIDEDGNPVVGQRIGIQMNSSIPASVAPWTVTDQNGSFATGKLSPGQYFIRISPKAGDFETVAAQFSEDDLKIVDQDVDPEAGSSVPVSPGATSSVGTITARKVPYYRAHVSVTGTDCAQNEIWMFSAIPKTPPFIVRYLGIPCGSEFLVRNLKPGSYWFTLRTTVPGETGKWAMAEVNITRENVSVPLVITQAAQVSARIVPDKDVTISEFQPISIMLRARLGNLLGWAAAGLANSDGKFVFKNLPWVRHDVSVQGLGGRYYVKEIRYNGVAMADGMVTPVPGSPVQNLEIVLDDQPATITGSVRDGDKPVSSPFIVAVKWPFTEGDVPVSGDGLKGDKDGRFQISGLAPGEYRLMAFNKIVRITELSSQLLSRAEKVTLERGSLKDISLKPIDPSK